MEIENGSIPGLLIIKPDIFKDSRGLFFESFNKIRFAEFGLNSEFVQDNISVSAKGTLRGLHFQIAPYAQGKLVSVVKGAVLDVAVDLRKGSAYFGKYFSIELSESNHTLFWLPAGFAHGFLALADDTVFSYKCTNIYHRESERSIRWNDPQLNIQWGIENPLVSEKDIQAPYLVDIEHTL
jgi:dTDP-4-dehydrorhamnose 3,5-epimerase